MWFTDGQTIRRFQPAYADCADGEACTRDVCDPATGACSNPTIGEGETCTDGAPCTTGETCTAGACGGSTATNCDDAEACTVDACGATSGCRHQWQFNQAGCCKTELWSSDFDVGSTAEITLPTPGNGWDVTAPALSSKSSVGALSISKLSGNGSWSASLPTMQLPDGVQSLTFWYYYNAYPSYSCCSSACDYAQLQVQVGDKIVWSANSSSGWQKATVDLKPYKASNQTILFGFVAQSAYVGSCSTSYPFYSTGSGVFVDDVTVTSTCP